MSREETGTRGVSTVLAVVLLVAITVALAAIAGALAFGLGERSGGPPQANFGFDYNGTGVAITHQGGTAIDAGELTLRIDTAAADWTEPDGTVGTGDRVHVELAGGERSILVVWEDDGGGAVLARFEIP